MGKDDRRKVGGAGEIKKRYEQVLETRKLTDRNLQQTQAMCTHQFPNGELAITVIKQQGQGGEGGGTRHQYRCSLCRKDVQVLAVSPEDIKTAVDTIDKLCDAVKFSADLRNENDCEVVARVAKIQDRVLNYLPKWYNAARENSRKSKNRNGGKNHRGDDTSWGRPVSR